jgi:hypothetical protein
MIPSNAGVLTIPNYDGTPVYKTQNSNRMLTSLSAKLRTKHQ